MFNVMIDNVMLDETEAEKLGTDIRRLLVQYMGDSKLYHAASLMGLGVAVLYEYVLEGGEYFGEYLIFESSTYSMFRNIMAEFKRRIRKADFDKGMTSNNPNEIEKLAVTFDTEGAAGAAAALRKHASTIKQ